LFPTALLPTLQRAQARMRTPARPNRDQRRLSCESIGRQRLLLMHNTAKHRAAWRCSPKVTTVCCLLHGQPVGSLQQGFPLRDQLLRLLLVNRLSPEGSSSAGVADSLSRRVQEDLSK
jgi:hypothetical protein